MKERRAGGRHDRRKAAEEKLDEEIEESFPASDPPSTTPTTAGAPARSGLRRERSGEQQKPPARG